MNKLDDLLTIPTACLIVLLAVVTILVRRLVEDIWPTLSSKTPVTVMQRIWENFILPALPAFMGLLFCVIVPPTLFPYPAVAAQTRVSLALYGFSLGWFSSGGYRYIVSVLKKKWNIDPPETPPPPDPAVPVPPTQRNV